MKYSVVIVPLSEEDGGGYYGIVPDLRGCMSDGATPEEAIANTQAAIDEWIDAANERGMTIPAPGSAAVKQRAEQARIMADLKSLSQGFDNMEARLQHLEQVIWEIDEALANADAWDRFAKLTGVGEVSSIRLVTATRLLTTR